jgi:transposase InsO family protein
MRFIRRVAEADLSQMSQGELAQVASVTPRTVRNWLRRKHPEDYPKLGRPAHDERAHRVAFWRVGRAYYRKGRCGWRSLREELGPEIPTTLIQLYVSRLKACKERHKIRRIAMGRERIEVVTKNSFWVKDSAQVAIDHDGGKVESLFIKDRGSLATVGIATTGPTQGADVVQLLDQLRKTRGLPLVIGSDNGAPFVCQEVTEYLKQHRVIHLRSLPRTPQQNGSAEVNIREIKDAAQLGTNLTASPSQAHKRAVSAATRINKNRERATKGFKTADQLDEEMEAGIHRVDRDLFYSECSRRIEEVRQSGLNTRAMRMAERGAIFETMERYGLIKRHRGGSQAATK